ncbi:MAG: PfaD family polyunsaturated fatty acid/polyketide biosynthesis protein [Desulfobacteraceae bacterium]|nr:PfaD family polyunsaturated fatty acid/polyketide biosynthesis protein [Desulfobacteraceae bacterium]MBC2755758.1 PfaD family polyunsaturated fatty acid/polyketide biosynthesis protein [Desulfobacteraceae bacterium]
MHASLNGYLKSSRKRPETGMRAIHDAIFNLLKPVFIVDIDGVYGVCQDGKVIINDSYVKDSDNYRLLSFAPPLHPENLGSSEFKNRYNIKYPYVAGAMAHGISSVELVKAAGNAGMIGFFGSAGLSLSDLQKAVIRLKSEAADIPYGVNLVFSGSSEQEFAIVDLYLKHGIHLISAAGYLKLTLPLLYYRIKGIYRNSDNTVICPNKIIAKTSRLEIAKQFLSPPPEKMINQLVDRELISQEEALLAGQIPVAEDLTAEADSGGHTDNRAAISLLPSMIDLRDDLFQAYKYSTMPCIGLGGGIATPKAVAAAFVMGADYVLTGSINQSCIESGTSHSVRQMLAKALQTDVMMAPSANMFERGIKVQVLKRGSMFPQRAARLYEIYRSYANIEEIPDDAKNEIENKIFHNSFKSEWQLTREFFKTYDPAQLELAENDPKRRMSLLFRSYLGKSSKWAINDETLRKKDFQIWCGPSMGAFNEWAKGSFLEDPENRQFETVSMNLLLGACVAMRRQYLVLGLVPGLIQGLPSGNLSLPPGIGKYKPMLLVAIKDLIPNNN